MLSVQAISSGSTESRNFTQSATPPSPGMASMASLRSGPILVATEFKRFMTLFPFPPTHRSAPYPDLALPASLSNNRHYGPGEVQFPPAPCTDEHPGLRRLRCPAQSE